MTNLALTDGADLKTWVLLIAGNIFIVVLVVRSVGHYAKREWGELLGHVLTGVVVAGIIYSPQTAVDLFKAIWQKVAG